jgi:uncharacterized integral membrane protein
MAKAKRPAVDQPVVGNGDVESSGRSGRSSVALIGGAVAAVFLVWFALANLSKVKINFWIYDRSEPLILVILIAGVLGAVIGALLMRARMRNKSEQ